MINSTNTINIDGSVLKDEEFINAFSFSKDDRFTQWVVRPLAMLAVVGMAVAAFFASAFILVLSLAMIPLLAIAFWAIKAKVERDISKYNSNAEVRTPTMDEPSTEKKESI